MQIGRWSTWSFAVLSHPVLAESELIIGRAKDGPGVTGVTGAPHSLRVMLRVNSESVHSVPTSHCIFYASKSNKRTERLSCVTQWQVISRPALHTSHQNVAQSGVVQFGLLSTDLKRCYSPASATHAA